MAKIIIMCLFLLVCGKQFAAAPISVEALFKPYEVFISTMNATTERDLQLATNGLAFSSMRSFTEIVSLCSFSIDRADHERLKWEGRSIDDVDMEKSFARAILLLNVLSVQSLQNIPPEINVELEREILRKNRNCVATARFFRINEQFQAEKILRDVAAKAPDTELLQMAKETDNSSVLDALANHTNVAIRIAVVTNRHSSFNSLNTLRSDGNAQVSRMAEKAFKQKYIFANAPDNFNQPASVFQAIALADKPEILDVVCSQLQSMPEAGKREMSSWLASRLCDLRFSPTPRTKANVGDHDLSLIGGKCAYLLEKLLDEKLVPVRRDTPLDTLKEQHKRLLKRVNDMQ